MHQIGLKRPIRSKNTKKRLKAVLVEWAGETSNQIFEDLVKIYQVSIRLKL